jgi:hypothetical protein
LAAIALAAMLDRCLELTVTDQSGPHLAHHTLGTVTNGRLSVVVVSVLCGWFAALEAGRARG